MAETSDDRQKIPMRARSSAHEHPLWPAYQPRLRANSPGKQ